MIIAEFSENTRVKISALVHTTRLGYEYLSLKDHKDDIDIVTNIFKSVFYAFFKFLKIFT